jgi:hypothetical protein
MYLVKDLDQIHSLLLTNFYLYFETEGVNIFTYSRKIKDQV